MIIFFIGLLPQNKKRMQKPASFLNLVMEQLMSTGGGWQDQAGGLCNGIKIITSEPSFNQILNVRHLNLSKETKEELNKRFCIIYSGETRLASNILHVRSDQKVQCKPERDNNDYQCLFAVFPLYTLHYEVSF